MRNPIESVDTRSALFLVSYSADEVEQCCLESVCFVSVDQKIAVTTLTYDMHSENTSSHTGRVHGLERFGSQDSAALAYIGSRWTRHYAYWTGRVNYPVITVRYEDLVDRPFPELMRILSILLPEEELPSLEQIICAVQGDNWKEAYQSRKESAFHAWSRFDDETRLQYLQLVQEPWCRYGSVEQLGLLDEITDIRDRYDQLLTIKTGIQSPILCKSVAAYNRTFAMNSKGQYLDDEQ